MLDRLIGLLAPHTCLVCDAEGGLVCDWCKPDALEAVPERCYRCKVITADSMVCTACRRVSPLKYVWTRTVYKDIAKELVYGLKFARAKAAAKQIAEFLDESTPVLPAGTIVTYIPTASSRVRQRGYDQTRLIAKHFAARRGLPCSSFLMRLGQTRQVGSDRKHRIDQASKNYSAIKLKQLHGANVLLIDDILTTGATIESAAKILKKAGAKQVSVAIFAQK